jgi:MFS transporter, DHA1 family, multidrug resistance protein
MMKVLFTCVYTALVYAIYYSFFEAFPIVYIGVYGFNLGQMGLTFLSISASVGLAIPSYWAYMYYIVEPEITRKGLPPPERCLIPALVVSFLLPIGLFIFGWTARTSVHWIVSVIGIGIYSYGVFILLQCIFVYIPSSYPQYSASLFAGNDFARSALASGSILFARPLYLNLGIGPGMSLLAGLTCACVGGIFALYFFGARMRARSKFAAR